jgi:hypothetical protein
LSLSLQEPLPPPRIATIMRNSVQRLGALFLLLRGILFESQLFGERNQNTQINEPRQAKPKLIRRMGFLEGGCGSDSEVKD